MWPVAILVVVCLIPPVHLAGWALIGWLVLAPVSVRYLLLWRMRKRGVDTALLPTACVAELATMCLNLAKGERSSVSKLMRLSEAIESAALEVAGISRGKAVLEDSYIAESLCRHGVVIRQSKGTGLSTAPKVEDGLDLAGN